MEIRLALALCLNTSEDHKLYSWTSGPIVLLIHPTLIFPDIVTSLVSIFNASKDVFRQTLAFLVANGK